MEKCIPLDLSDHVINFLHKVLTSLNVLDLVPLLFPQVPYGQGSLSKTQLHSLLRRHCQSDVTEATPEATPTVCDDTPPMVGVAELFSAWETVCQDNRPSQELLAQLNKLCTHIQTFISRNS